MKRFLIFLLIVAVGIGVLGYYRGWFSVSKDGNVKVQVDSEKFKKDKEAFGKAASQKAQSLKNELTSLRTKSEGLKGDEKASTQKELDELEKKRDRLEEQIKELNDAEPDRLSSIRDDLNKNLKDVEDRIEVLTKRLDAAKDKKK